MKGNDDRARAQARERCRPVEVKRCDRVVDRDTRDREPLPLWVRDANRDLTGLELDPPDVELVARRRLATNEVDERGARRGEHGDGADEQQNRKQRPHSPRPLAEGFGRRGRAGFHQSTTSKKPIHPSSVNSDWWAWNMKRPVLWKSISTMPRWPWQSITVSV